MTTDDRLEAARARLAAWTATNPRPDVAHGPEGRLRRARLMVCDLDGRVVEVAHLNRDWPAVVAFVLEAAGDLAAALGELDRARAELAEALEDRERCEAENVELQARLFHLAGPPPVTA